MAQLTINIGSSANKGDGDPIRVAFNKVNTNFTEVYTKLTALEDGHVATDVSGNVFAEDSTLLVDAINAKIPAANLSGALPAIDGSALTGISVVETDPVVGATNGLVKADGAGNISQAVAGTDYLTTVELSSDTTPQLGGNLDTNGNDIIFQDSDHLFLGTDSDLDFYHDGANARLQNSRGFIYVRTPDSFVIDGTSGGTLARFLVGQGVELRYQNNVKLDTVSYGVSITGLAKLSVLTSAPTSPADGMVAIADGSGWDPMTNGVQTMVVYLNGAWREIANAV